MDFGEITVLHVDDEPGFAEMVHTFLERERESLRVVTEMSARAGLERLATETIDCVVSDFDMPQMDGLAFLREVRAEHPDLPFVLFTAQGSEEIAANAISAGVSDYLQKGTGAEQYVVLANRIENLVEQYRAQQETASMRRRFSKLVRDAVDLVTVVDETGGFSYVSPAAESVLGYDPDDLLGTNAFDYVHPEDRERTWAMFAALLDGGEESVTDEIRLRHADGSWVWVENRGKNLRDDPDVGGVVAYTRDISGRKAREQTLRRYEAIVENMADVVYIVDTSYAVTLVNQASIDFAGLPRSTVEGTDVRELTRGMVDDEAAKDQFDTALTDVLSGASTNERLSFDIETTVGPVRSELDISALVAEDGTTEGAVVISRPIPDDGR